VCVYLCVCECVCVCVWCGLTVVRTIPSFAGRVCVRVCVGGCVCVGVCVVSGWVRELWSTGPHLIEKVVVEISTPR
jgi:hypothetical protein